MPPGRPSSFNPDTAATICARLSEGLSLREVCSAEGMPDKATIFRWMAANPDFRDQYAKAKQEGIEALAEELLDIADDGRNDWMERKDESGAVTGYQFNGEAFQRSRLRVDTRKWILSKLVPKKYGDRQEIEHKGSGLVIQIVEPDPK